MESIIDTVWNAVGSSEIFQGGLVLSVIYGLARYGKEIFLFLKKRIVRKVMYSCTIDETSDMYKAFSEWYFENYKSKYRYIEAKINHSEKGKIALGVTQFEDFNIVKYKNRLLSVFKEREKLENANSLFNLNYNKYTIQGLFAKKAIKELLDEVFAHYKNNLIKEKNIYKWNVSEYEWYRKPLECIKTFDNLFFEGKDKIINDVEKYLENRERYTEKGISLKRTYHLEGEPGIGKTAVAFAIASMLKRDIYDFNLNDFKDDKSLRKFLSMIKSESIILMDDYDRSFDKKGNINEEINISKQLLLSVLSGNHLPKDVIIIQTSNCTSLFDSAITRKGRIDFRMTFHKPVTKYLEEYLNYYYDTNDLKLQELDYNITMVDLEEICKTSKSVYEAKEKLINLNNKVKIKVA